MRIGINDMCFACGKKNPIGLKLDFQFEGDECITHFEVRPEYQGYWNILHGGIITTLLDEVMAWIILHQDLPTVTAKLSVTLKQPIPVGERITVKGRISKIHLGGRAIETEAALYLADGTLAAEATGLSVRQPAQGEVKSER